MSWNIRSVNDLAKVKRILDGDSTFTLLQEVWCPNKDIIPYFPSSMILKARPEGQTGGGTMTLWNEGIATTCGRSYDVNQDSFIPNSL